MTVRSWPEVRIRFVARLNPSKSEVSNLPRETEVTFLPMDAIGDGGSIRLDATRPLAAVDQGYTYFRDGDVAIAKITPCFENGKGALMSGLLGGIGFGTTELIVVRPDHCRITGPFLQWLFTSPHFRNAAEAAMYGAGGQKRVPDDFVRDFAILLPTLAEQSTIEAFLDRETGKIDALVAEQERLIALLKEKRQAVISHAVTKGLNPNAPMKDSGVPWLGEVPAHWEVKRLKQLVTAGTSISYGIVQPGEPQISGVPFVQTTNMTSGQFGFDDLQKTTLEIASNYPRSRLTGGEVLLGIRASIGAAFVAQAHLKGANLSRGVARIVPNSAIMAKYLVEFLGTQNVSDYWGQMRQGSTFNEVSIETVREMCVTVPPKLEQGNLVEVLQAKSAEFDDFSAAAIRAMTLLRERRAALISAAVTGKIDVRDTVAQPSSQAA